MYKVYYILLTTILASLIDFCYTSDIKSEQEIIEKLKISNSVFSISPHIHIIQSHQHEHFLKELDQMFCKRHKVFVEKLGWKLSSINGRERDQYDTKNAVYMLSINNGQVNGGMRLLPTEKGNYMLREIFPNLVDHDPDKLPESKKVWESTRFFIDVPKDNKKCFDYAHRTTVELIIALYEFGLSLGVEKILGVSMPHVEDIIKNMGCQYSRLSDGKFIDGKPIVVLSLEISKDNLQTVREKTNIHKLVSHPINFSQYNKSRNFVRSAL